MKHYALAALFLTGLSGLHAESPPVLTESSFLTDVRQLIFEGKRSGEGYFSKDGSKMVFQSEREADNPFYQIYLRDMETGDTERVSPGVGKTTCGWIHPDGTKVMFSSTHLDAQAKSKEEDEITERKSGRVRKYSWDYDENYDIFAYSVKDKSLQRLTDAKGYDAEGAYSPDGAKIVFASNRAAYARELTKEESDRLKIDKSFFMDIYIMNADGTEVKQLTDVPGYDGGAFFSADGKKICWRRFDEKGMIAEIYTMNVDGSDQRQITRVGAMSWAPYFHPSGDYLIFSNNTQGFTNFELFIVDAKGERDPVRVTYTDKFDSLPVFTPDGTKLSWTSGRTPDGTSQIFMAQWNDETARKALKLPTAAEVAKSTPGKTEAEEIADPNAPDPATTAAEIKPEDLKQHLTYLASDALEGRMTGTRGEILATQYIAQIFQHLGLKPFGQEGPKAWYDEFTFTAGVALGKDNRMTLTHKGESKELITDKDWRPLSFSQTGEIKPAEVIFAGYGVETPDAVTTSATGSKLEPYSSYAHLDVKDKWVLVLRYLPEDITQERRNELSVYASLRHKALTARQKGARGILIASGPNSKVVEQLVPMGFDASLASSGIAVVSITNEVADQLLASGGKNLKDLQTKLDTGDMMGGIACPDLTLGGQVDISQEKKTGRNVIGILPKGEVPDFHTPPLIICAHIDHLGSRGGSNSRAKGDEASKIHHGADDNASGTAGMLEIAQWLAGLKKEGKLDLKRDIVFAGWSGEELGLLGSNHFVSEYAKMITGDPNGKLTGMFAACLNMDMIGRFNKNLVLQGVGSSSWWPKEIEQRNAVVGLPITIQKDAHLATDSTTFYLRGIPTLNAFTGAHEDYHMPSDTADKINYDRAAQIARLMGLIARAVVITHDIPDYIAMEAPKNQGTRTGLRVYLGSIPDYAQGDIKGVKLSGVSPVGPAAKAGVKSGDIVIKLGEKAIQNIYDYTYVMGELKVGVETTIIVQRDGKDITLKITPGSRD